MRRSSVTDSASMHTLSEKMRCDTGESRFEVLVIITNIVGFIKNNDAFSL